MQDLDMRSYIINLVLCSTKITLARERQQAMLARRSFLLIDVMAISMLLKLRHTSLLKSGKFQCK